MDMDNVWFWERISAVERPIWAHCRHTLDPPGTTAPHPYRLPDRQPIARAYRSTAFFTTEGHGGPQESELFHSQRLNHAAANAVGQAARIQI